MSQYENNLIRQNNLNTLRATIKEQPYATVSTLTRLTGLSAVTINALLEKLLADDIIRVGESTRSKLGRPARTYVFNAERFLSLLFSLYKEEDTDMMEIYVCDMYGKPIYSDKHPMPFEMEFSFDGDIERLLKAYPAINVIGFGIPGIVANGKIAATNYPALRTVDLISHLRNRFSVDVFFENDINAAVFGYCASHPECMDQTIAAIYLPRDRYSGVGVCIDGKLITGASGMAGEIMHLPSAESWFQMDPSDDHQILRYLQKLIQTYMCILNPDRILIYADMPLPALNPWDIYDYSSADPSFGLENIQFPEILMLDTFHADYFYGLSCHSIQLQNLLFEEMAAGSVN